MSRHIMRNELDIILVSVRAQRFAAVTANAKRARANAAISIKTLV